jgi:hypothetical protein
LKLKIGLDALACWLIGEDTSAIRMRRIGEYRQKRVRFGIAEAAHYFLFRFEKAGDIGCK